MKRLTLLSLFACLLCQVLWAQTIVSTAPSTKKVILEEMTGWTCPNCPAGHTVANNILVANPGNVFVIAYHPTGSSYTVNDPMISTYAGAFYNSSFIAAGTGGRSMPSAMVNRRTGSAGDRLQGRSDWPSNCDIMKVETSPLNVGVSSSYNASTKSLTVNVEVYFTADVANNVTLYTMITEDGIVANQSGGSTNYVHNHVFRQALPTPSPATWGQPITTPTSSGTLKTFTYTFDNTSSNFDMSKCEIVAFVRNASNEEIISGNGSAVGAASGIESKTKDSFRLSVYPNPMSDNAVLSFELANSNDVSYEVYDITGNLITSKSLGKLKAGEYHVELNTEDFAKGIYFISINHGASTLKVIK